MEERITLRQWKINFMNGLYNDKSRTCQIEAGWYDWFCNDSALAGRLQKFGKIISKITNDFLLDNYYVWFKNNCPLIGPLYDDMRFEPLNEELRGAYYFGIAIDNKLRSEHKYEIFTARADFATEACFDRQSEVVKFLNNWKVGGNQNEDD